MYIFHTDPGHGWLQVPIAELQKLGIENQISNYSYIDADYAYLEEDRDAQVFFEARERAGYILNHKKIREENTNHDSPIRNKERYQSQARA